MAKQKKYLDYDGLLYVKSKIKTKIDSKVDKAFKTGSEDQYKVLSDENYTTEEKSKLSTLKNYELPKASSETLGGIKVGAGLTISEEGTLSATGGGTADSVAWENITDKPTTIAGYKIIDAKIEDKTITLGSNSVKVPTNNNELENGKGYQTADNVSSAINAAVSNKVTTEAMNQAITIATNDMATKTYVNQQLANINKKQIVSSTTEMTDANTIYLIANSGSGNNIYDEYIVINGKAEKIGTTEIDLTNYLRDSDLVKISNEEIDTAFTDF